MACIVAMPAVTGLCPWPAITALTGADVVAFGASMLVLSPRSGDGSAFMLGQLLVPLGTGSPGLVTTGSWRPRRGAALAANSQPVTRRSSSQLGGRGWRAVLRGWCGWGGGAQPVQQGPGQGREGDRAEGAEDRVLAVDADPGGGGDSPAQRPQ